MPKILILSYFFPPCGFTASRRVESWAKELAKSGFEVDVVTRKWETPIKTYDDIHHGTTQGIERVEKDGYKVHFMPYIPNRRDRLVTSRKWKLMRKLLTTYELIFQNHNYKICPFSNLYDEARNLVLEDKPDLILISGNPYIQFQFGYKLNKEFDIPWIADYRDGWTTSTINNIGRGWMYRLYEKLDRPFEKKWIRTASLVTASSREIGKGVEELTGISSMPIFNGYDENLFHPYQAIEKQKDYFQIAYIGTLYPGQNVELFLGGFKKFIDNEKVKVKMLFPGLLVDPIQAKRIQEILKGYEEYYEIQDRIPFEKILTLEKQSHILVHFAWDQHKGIIASKIYEYIGSGTKIALSPGDNSAVEHIVKDSGCGAVLDSIEEVEHFLKSEYEMQLASSNALSLSEENKDIHKYTRQHQAQNLIDLIGKLIS